MKRLLGTYCWAVLAMLGGASLFIVPLLLTAAVEGSDWRYAAAALLVAPIIWKGATWTWDKQRTYPYHY